MRAFRWRFSKGNGSSSMGVFGVEIVFVGDQSRLRPKFVSPWPVSFFQPHIRWRAIKSKFTEMIELQTYA